jgi:hypothetical protein
MRKILLITLTAFAAVLLTSCITTSGVKKEQPPAQELVDDWEYKGFGRELPAWVEQYFLGDIATVQAVSPEYAGKEIQVISASGKNADQAEQALIEKVTGSTSLKGYALKESIWVRLQREKDITLYGGNAYVSLFLYVKQ